ncbi:MAG: sigma-70 family RNA polymerase sigma factor [Terracidiphilus sp.]|jgi:RNA polymerase sigma-70 factor (ECF subfamily)
MATGVKADWDEQELRRHLFAFHRGDMDGFEALFRRHQRAVYGWILRIVRDAGTAEELTVETFWRISRAHARFDPSRGFEGWARRIATHAALDWMRTRRAERELTTELPEDSAAKGFADPAVSAEIRQKTAAAFERLPPKLRIAAVLAVVEEQPQKDVAEALGISVAAVKLRVFRALRLLRKDLEQQGIRP